MGLNDRIDDALSERGQKYRKLSRKKAARHDANQHLADLLRRRHALHAQPGEPDADRLRRLGLEIDATKETLERLSRRIPSLKEAIERLTALIRRLKAQREQPDVVVQAGSPHWGGCEDILNNEVVPVAKRMGRYVTSGKRVETFGNPSSDHYIGNVTASARDFQPGVDLAIAIARELGIGYYGYGQDYQLFYISRAGRTFRVQVIASPHGTGPHCHVGIRLA